MDIQQFLANIKRDINTFEKENNVTIDVLRYGICVTEDGKLIWGKGTGEVSVEYRKEF